MLPIRLYEQQCQERIHVGIDDGQQVKASLLYYFCANVTLLYY